MSVEARLRLYLFVAFAAFGLYLPFFPSWLIAQGLTGWKMSAVAFLMPALSLVAPPLIGLLADQWGLRGRLITVMGVVAALSCTGLAIGTLQFETVPLAFVMLCMGIFAIARGPAVGLADVLAMESGSDYGRIRLFGSLGFLVSAGTGGELLDASDPHQLPIALATVIWFMSLISVSLPRTSHLPPRPALSDMRELVKQPSFKMLLWTMLSIFVATSAYDLTLSLRIADLGGDDSSKGQAWALGTAAEIFVMAFSRKWVARWGSGRMLAIAAACMTGRWILIASVTNLDVLLLSQLLHGITFGLMWVAAVSTLVREVDDKGMATGQGLMSMATAIGASSGMWIWGPLYEKSGSEEVFFVAAFAALVATLFAMRLIRK